MSAVTALYVPGDRPDRFEKAVAAGPDILILDLEDAVAPQNRRAALASVVNWLRDYDESGRPAIQVRLNKGADAEIESLLSTGRRIGLRIPKVESESDLDAVASIARDLPLTALIESSRGVQRADSIAAHPSVVALGLGESDLASELGTRDTLMLDQVRVRLLIAARAAGLAPPMLSAYPAILDLEGLRGDTERGRRLGWHGRAAIHPRQLSVIREVFQPRPEDAAWARAVIEAMGAAGVATLPNGEMVDAAMMRRARHLLEE
ncbi:MAG: HpcH/HpaI aldolase/citrate lyase family protein [Microbacterium sp.]|uniref:HpcH/HpaI aldolase/citrate lyase family protein n=1 Tax=Microbacterium sp. TaxID=51671 RepID=UPI003F815AAC